MEDHNWTVWDKILVRQPTSLSRIFFDGWGSENGIFVTNNGEQIINLGEAEFGEREVNNLRLHTFNTMA